MQRTSYSPCCALPHKFYRILTLRLEGAFGRLCDFVSVCPLRIALIMTPSPNLHLLHFPMPDIPHISNMTFNAQMYWQNFDDDTPLSSISLHVCSCIEIFYVIASVLQFDIIASFYYFLLWCGWFYMKQLLSHFFALFPSIPPRCGRIPSWCVPLLISILDQIYDHLQAVFLPFMDAFIYVDRHWQSPSCD
jgi:hypothetical protein